MKTPWGKSQTEDRIVDGVTRVTTASHGGVKLDRRRNAAVHPAWRQKGGWYEEDVHICVVAYTFPVVGELLGILPRTVECVLKNYYPHQWVRATGRGVTAAESRVLREEAFTLASQGKWVSSAAWGNGCNTVIVFAVLDGQGGPEGYFAVPSTDYHSVPIAFADGAYPRFNTLHEARAHRGV